MSKVFVTGFGAISAIGNSALEARSSLINGTSGIKKARFFKSNYVNSLLFGEIPLNDEDFINLTNSPKNSGLTRTSLIALAAFQQAITSANLSEEALQLLAECATRMNYIKMQIYKVKLLNLLDLTKHLITPFKLPIVTL